MKQRGRKSEAAKEIDSLAPQPAMVVTEPPADLTAEEADVWRSVIKFGPAGWFGQEHVGALKGLCRHVCYADRLANLIRAQESDTDEGKVLLCKLMTAHERETRAHNALARSMRLTHQSQYDAKHAFVRANNGETGERLPWENH